MTAVPRKIKIGPPSWLFWWDPQREVETRDDSFPGGIISLSSPHFIPPELYPRKQQPQLQDNSMGSIQTAKELHHLTTGKSQGFLEEFFPLFNKL